jgi:hypothetical protein
MGGIAMATAKVITVRCDGDSISRLRELVQTWPRVIAAQQSNILRDAKDRVTSEMLFRDAVSDYRVRLPLNAIAPTDGERLLELCELWPTLDGKTQIACLDTARFVSEET